MSRIGELELCCEEVISKDADGDGEASSTKGVIAYSVGEETSAEVEDGSAEKREISIKGGEAFPMDEE